MTESRLSRNLLVLPAKLSGLENNIIADSQHPPPNDPPSSHPDNQSENTVTISAKIHFINNFSSHKIMKAKSNEMCIFTDWKIKSEKNKNLNENLKKASYCMSFGRTIEFLLSYHF